MKDNTQSVATDDPRFRLLGKYRTPRFNYGAVVMDEARGEVVIVGLTDALIPWPIGKRGRTRAMVLFGDLARAVRRESNQAIQYWWGVTAQTVSKWRKALGVGPSTAGTSLRRRELMMPRHSAMREMIDYDAPERSKKIADARRGKKRPRHVVQALSRAHAGKTISEEARRKMSDAHKRRGTRPPAAGRPWAAEEDALLGLPAETVAEKTGRTVIAVKDRQRKLRRRG